jgi:hypothetical protein
MLIVQDCERRADECARLAEAARDPVQNPRYRHLELSWLYLLRLKARARFAARQGMSLPSVP